MPDLSNLLTVSDAARSLGVSEGTIRAWADNGRLACVRTIGNGSRLFHQKDIDRAAAQMAEAQ
jgi:excisionase family DNA binding protein